MPCHALTSLLSIARISHPFVLVCPAALLSEGEGERPSCPSGRDDDLARCMTGWMGEWMCEDVNQIPIPVSQGTSGRAAIAILRPEDGITITVLCFLREYVLEP